MIVIEVSSYQLDNIFCFANIIEQIEYQIISADIVLFVNTAREKCKRDKLYFLHSVLASLNMNVSILIDTEIKKFYDCILLKSKLEGAIQCNMDDLDSVGMIAHLTHQLISDIFPNNTPIISLKQENMRGRYYPQIVTFDLPGIRKIVSTEENIIYLQRIMKIFDKTDIDYSNRYGELKDKLIDTLSNIQPIAMNFFSIPDIYPDLCKRANLKNGE